MRLTPVKLLRNRCGGKLAFAADKKLSAHKEGKVNERPAISVTDPGRSRARSDSSIMSDSGMSYEGKVKAAMNHKAA